MFILKKIEQAYFFYNYCHTPLQKKSCRRLVIFVVNASPLIFILLAWLVVKI